MSGRDERVLKDYPKCGCFGYTFWIVEDRTSVLTKVCFVSDDYNNRSDIKYPKICCNGYDLDDFDKFDRVRKIGCNFCHRLANNMERDEIIKLGKLYIEQGLTKSMYINRLTK